MNITGKFFAYIRQKLFKRQIEWEVYKRIFPHLKGEKKFRYPFNSDSKLCTCILHENLDAKLYLQLIEHEAKQMPKAYKEAFRYIMYRNLIVQMEMYLVLARQRGRRNTSSPEILNLSA